MTKQIYCNHKAIATNPLSILIVATTLQVLQNRASKVQPNRGKGENGKGWKWKKFPEWLKNTTLYPRNFILAATKVITAPYTFSWVRGSRRRDKEEQTVLCRGWLHYRRLLLQERQVFCGGHCSPAQAVSRDGNCTNLCCVWSLRCCSELLL